MSSLPGASIKSMQSDDSYAAEEGIEIAVEHGIEITWSMIE